jgi:hypothetical protein
MLVMVVVGFGSTDLRLKRRSVDLLDLRVLLVQVDEVAVFGADHVHFHCGVQERSEIADKVHNGHQCRAPS